MSLVGVEVVEREFGGVFFSEELRAEFPLREIAAGDGLKQVAPMEVVVRALQLGSLIPNGRLQAQLGAPMELDEGALALGVQQPEAVDAETFHHAQAARNGAIAHGPDDGVHCLGHQVSCALAACGKPRSGSIFTACTRSGNFIAS